MRFIDTSWKEHLSVFLRDIPLRGGYTGYNESLGKERKITGYRGNTRGIAFFPCEFGRNLTFMLPFFPPHLYKASIAATGRSADPFSVHPLMGLDRPSGGIALFLCLDKTPKSYFERATLKEKCSLIQWPLAIVKRISVFCSLYQVFLSGWDFHIYAFIYLSPRILSK